MVIVMNLTKRCLEKEEKRCVWEEEKREKGLCVRLCETSKDCEGNGEKAKCQRIILDFDGREEEWGFCIATN
jgi:hypothetical protein